MTTLSADRYVCLVHDGKITNVLADPDYTKSGPRNRCMMVLPGGKCTVPAVGFNGETDAKKQIDLIRDLFFNDLAICSLEDDNTFKILKVFKSTAKFNT